MKERERVSDKESDMRIENCQLFEAFEKVHVKRTTGYCLPVGLKAECQGDQRFCERLETMRKGMITSIDKENQTGGEA